MEFGDALLKVDAARKAIFWLLAASCCWRAADPDVTICCPMGGMNPLPLELVLGLAAGFWIGRIDDPPRCYPYLPSPPTFCSSYTNSLIRLALPESNIYVGVSQGCLDYSSHQYEILDCVDNLCGLFGPVPSLDVPLSGSPGSSVACDAVAGALPLTRPHSPCQDNLLLSDGLPGEFNDSVSKSISSLGAIDPTCYINPQDSIQLPSKDEQSRLAPQLNAFVNPSSTPIFGNPLGVVDCPLGASWSFVVKQNTPGGSMVFCLVDSHPMQLIGCWWWSVPVDFIIAVGVVVLGSALGCGFFYALGILDDDHIPD
ncbi:hypothetical protein Nepgr_016492 [Nepenthes gracilis]|uniref:Uncharacterized protein n=1 Tax=Nepenthes gracilis TaxID=150966 RepID=A0AAD3SQG2_NEPGR|nr:hypothetical protein Nepgr_016492 [Nepenthes gracilis]